MKNGCVNDHVMMTYSEIYDGYLDYGFVDVSPKSEMFGVVGF